MINARNTLGTNELKGRRTTLVGVALALAALLLLVREGSAQASDVGTTVAGVEIGQAVSDFELLGQVRDGESGVVLEGAWVGLSGTDWGSITDNEGRFRIPDTSAGQLSLTIEGLGYEAMTWVGEVESGDVLLIEMVPEPILLEGLEVVTDRFRSRRNGFAGNVFAFDAGDLASTSDPTALDFVRYRSGSAVVSCNGQAGDMCLSVRGRTVEPVVYVDEMPIFGGLKYLESTPPWEFHMVEIYGGGRHIRAYTTGFMKRAARQRLTPIPILF